jgi:hypothetical protein
VTVSSTAQMVLMRALVILVAASQMNSNVERGNASWRLGDAMVKMIAVMDPMNKAATLNCQARAFVDMTNFNVQTVSAFQNHSSATRNLIALIIQMKLDVNHRKL